MTNLLSNPGNYKNLYCYQKAEAIYDITYYFCKKYLDRRDRTVDQMVQAARSGKQNIVEGCAASATSSSMEIKLINVAKASLHELLIDYEDYLRTRNHHIWEDGSIEKEAMRALSRRENSSAFYMELISTRPPETIANIAICLIKQNDYLLYKLLDKLSRQFVSDGGFRERMTRIRRSQRGKR